MAEMKYADNIITDARPFPSDIGKKREAQIKKNKSTLEGTHLLTVDRSRIKNFFYVDGSWLWKGKSNGPIDEEHRHDYDEVIGFVGAHKEDPHDLGGDVTIWIDGNKHTLSKSSLIFVPAGMKHGPVQIDRIDYPIFSVNIALVGKYSRSKTEINTPASGEKPKYAIVDKTKENFSVAAAGGNAPPPPKLNPLLKSTRLLHLEDDIAKGSFYVDFVWIYEGDGGAPAPEHSHEWVELIAMVGADPEHPHDIGGTMSIVLGDETHYITKSSLVCIPAGLKHCPWKFIGIKKPTLVFTAGPSGMYTGTHKKDKN
jgi:mannose-6-phosphate isomerase-like protein (cupin superfamily)